MLYPQIRRLPKCSPSTIHRTVSIAPLISKEWNVLLYSLEVQYSYDRVFKVKRVSLKDEDLPSYQENL